MKIANCVICGKGMKFLDDTWFHFHNNHVLCDDKANEYLMFIGIPDPYTVRWDESRIAEILENDRANGGIMSGNTEGYEKLCG